VDQELLLATPYILYTAERLRAQLLTRLSDLFRQTGYDPSSRGGVFVVCRDSTGPGTSSMRGPPRARPARRPGCQSRTRDSTAEVPTGRRVTDQSRQAEEALTLNQTPVKQEFINQLSSI